MTDQTSLPDLPIEMGPRSSILEKTTPELRRTLDRAILNYDPPGYLALFKKYGLADLGVSYQAFYQYARKLRQRAALHDRAVKDGPDELQFAQSLPSLIGQFLHDQLMADEETDPQAIYRLVLAYTAALKNTVFIHDNSRVFALGSEPGGPAPVAGAGPAPRLCLDRTGHRVVPDSAVLDITDDTLSRLSVKEGLACANSLLALKRGALEKERALAQSEFEKVRMKWIAQGYPVENARTIDGLCAIVDRIDKVSPGDPLPPMENGNKEPARENYDYSPPPGKQPPSAAEIPPPAPSDPTPQAEDRRPSVARNNDLPSRHKSFNLKSALPDPLTPRLIPCDADHNVKSARKLPSFARRYAPFTVSEL